MAAKGADVLYTDVWVSMGEPVEVWAERIDDLAALPGQPGAHGQSPGPKCRVHALPARLTTTTRPPWARRWARSFGRDAMEVTDEVFESPQSIVFDEAENRMHTIKAVMAATLGYEA